MALPHSFANGQEADAVKVNDNFAALEALIADLGLPQWESGDSKWSFRATPSTGWLLCNGQAVSRTTYASLFAAIGTTHGVGDGATTFNLPPGAGRTLVGAGSGSGLTPRSMGALLGAETIVLTAGQLPAHDHNAYQAAHAHGGSASISAYLGYNAITNNTSSGSGNAITGITGPSGGNTSTTLNGSGTISADSQTPAVTVNDVGKTRGGAIENMQPSLVANLFIKI